MTGPCRAAGAALIRGPWPVAAPVVLLLLFVLDIAAAQVEDIDLAREACAFGQRGLQEPDINGNCNCNGGYACLATTLAIGRTFRALDEPKCDGAKASVSDSFKQAGAGSGLEELNDRDGNCHAYCDCLTQTCCVGAGSMVLLDGGIVVSGRRSFSQAGAAVASSPEVIVLVAVFAIAGAA